MLAETSQLILNSFLETLKIIGMVILLMIVIGGLGLKHKDEIRRKIITKLYEKRNRDRLRNLK